MSLYSLTLRDVHLDEIKALLLKDDSCEHAAYFLCNLVSIGRDPWDGCLHQKFQISSVIAVPSNQFIESTPNRVTWNTSSFVRVLKQSETENSFVGIVHNHPGGSPHFSNQDDVNESVLVQGAVNRNGYGTKLISLILTPDGQLNGRVWLRPIAGAFENLHTIRTTGRNLRFHNAERSESVPKATWHRQALAFGNAFNKDLRQVRIGIVGCGGTGSATAMLLARLGVGQILLIDNDTVDQTNLNRLHGARQSDVDAIYPKVKTVARAITELGLGVRVIPLKAWVGDPKCRDELRACDVLFGCTDDHEGRLFLNRFAYYYLTTVIDMGLAIEVDKGCPPAVKALDGRVTVLGPTHACLICQGVINPELARAETMRRSDPEIYEQRKTESYVIGEGDPNPAVVTFTTELACMAVNELIHRMQGFRGPRGASPNRVRRFHLNEDRRLLHEPVSDCPICTNETIWGKGDVEPFMDRVD